MFNLKEERQRKSTVTVNNIYEFKGHKYSLLLYVDGLVFVLPVKLSEIFGILDL